MLLDGLDGRVARLTSTASEFGKEFDSLADMVSFGLAPAIVVYQWGVERLAEYGADLGPARLARGVPVCGGGGVSPGALQ